MSAAAKKWKVPAWMKPYLEIIHEDPEDIERAMNCRNTADGCDIVVNAPRAMMCLARSSKATTLQVLKNNGFLK